MHGSTGLSVSQRISAELGERDVASVKVSDLHLVTFGKLKDGGILVTSSYSTSGNETVIVSSLEIPAGDLSAALPSAFREAELQGEVSSKPAQNEISSDACGNAGGKMKPSELCRAVWSDAGCLEVDSRMVDAAVITDLISQRRNA